MKSLKISGAFIVLFFFFGFGQSFGQNSINLSPNAFNANFVETVPMTWMNEYGPYFESQGKKIKGSPYIFEGKWIMGNVQTPSGPWINDIEFRFNTSRHELEVKLTDKNQVLLVPNKNVKGFKISNSGNFFTFRNGFKATDGSLSKYSLVQVLYDGNTKLVKYYNTKHIEGRQPDYSTGLIVDKFITDVQFYLMNSSNELEPVKLKKKDILKVLDSNKDKIENYADESNLSFKKEENLIQILSHYDQINK